MPVTVDRNETHWHIRLEGELALTSAAELKRTLLEWLASGKELQLDLERAEAIDITVMQLLWAAGQEAVRAGIGMMSRVPEAAAMAARDAGFKRFPGAAAQE